MQQLNFEEILETNKEKIYRICKIYAVAPIEPQDLFQEVVYQIWKSVASFKGNSSVDTWVYRIALNVCMRLKLKLQKDGARTIRFDAIQFKESQTSTSHQTEEKFELLKQCITTLNDGDTVIVLLYLEELSYKQIAETTGLTENHIAVKMKRIRKKLLNCIRPKLS